ncbi:MAG: NAD(+) synthase, partial [Pseudomonadota bacterium]
GLSVGIDSALSATIAFDAIGAENVSGVMMPSQFTSQDSLEDAADIAQKLGLHYSITPISELVENFMGLLPNTSGLAHENLQARLRGLILMTLSNQTGAMVLTTGNKSEMATGYATLYGDMCGGYNVLKDIYKTQVYNLARWRNTSKPIDTKGHDGILINERTITKAPTAELRAGQIDQDNLPPYDELDQILTGLVESEMGITQMVERGFDKATVKKVALLLKISEFKRRQSALGPKVSSRAFTRERRYPIANGF